MCQYAANENYIHQFTNGTDWYETPEAPREVGVYFFQGPAPDYFGLRLTQKHVLRYGVLYVLRRAHELSGGAFDLEAAKAAVPPKEVISEDGGAEGEDEVEGPGGAEEPDSAEEDEAGGVAAAAEGIKSASREAASAAELVEGAKKEAEDIGRRVQAAKEKLEEMQKKAEEADKTEL